MELYLPPFIRDQIHREAVAAYPDECCGILIGREVAGTRMVEHAVTARNVHDQRHNRFAIDPRAQLNAEREAEAAGMVVLGFYHSHPDHPAIPSVFDRDHALPNFTYIITSVQNAKAVDMRAWRLRPDREQFDAGTLIIEQGT